eukprot:TRINITY_DN3713_c0_g1_i2.p1 TRINITY_DN3713_c0_g1~~TRINITY_DN3713_c0_g1_i2.p1  ORF type:complete len:212 (+),score=21.40 TRINITY_DN3713_c0_g1_i2:183-818(+)
MLSREASSTARPDCGTEPDSFSSSGLGRPRERCAKLLESVRACVELCGAGSSEETAVTAPTTPAIEITPDPVRSTARAFKPAYSSAAATQRLVSARRKLGALQHKIALSPEEWLVSMHQPQVEVNKDPESSPVITTTKEQVGSMRGGWSTQQRRVGGGDGLWRDIVRKEDFALPLAERRFLNEPVENRQPARQPRIHLQYLDEMVRSNTHY